jgi:type IV pilus assembly protein PilO
LVQKEVTLKKDFETKVQEAANLKAYETQMVEMKEMFSGLLKQLPGDTEVPGLLDDISNKGLESGLVFNSIDLQSEKTQAYYIELPIKINVTGDYHDFGSFVSGVAALPRIVTLHDFKIEKVSESKQQKDPDEIIPRGRLTMEIIAKTYRYRDQES